MKVAPAKVIGIILIVLLMLAVAGILWMFFSSDLTISFDGCIATDPTIAQGDLDFNTIKEQMESDTFVGTRFSEAELGAADEYVFYTWTVDIKNDTFLQADIIEIQVIPTDGDIAQLGAQPLFALDAHTEGKLSATILTGRSVHNARNAIVTWYFWGTSFSQKIKLY